MTDETPERKCTTCNHMGSIYPCATCHALSKWEPSEVQEAKTQAERRFEPRSRCERYDGLEIETRQHSCEVRVVVIEGCQSNRPAEAITKTIEKLDHCLAILRQLGAEEESNG